MIGPIMGGAPRLKWDPSKVNIIADGDSFFAPGSAYLGLIESQAPLGGRFTIANVAIGGQTFRMMNGLDGGSTTDVDAAYVPGKTNVLLTTGHTNTIIGGRPVADTIQDQIDYNTARKAAMPGLIIVGCTTIPRELAQSDANIWIYNQRLNDYDAYVKANFRAMGMAACVDVRTGTRFDFVGDSAAAFDAVADIMPEYYAIHPNAAGYAIMAEKWAPVLASLRAR